MQPPQFDWFAQPALETGLPNWACFCMFLHAFDDISLCLLRVQVFQALAPSGPAQRVWGSGCRFFRLLELGWVLVRPTGLRGFGFSARRKVPAETLRIITVQNRQNSTTDDRGRQCPCGHVARRGEVSGVGRVVDGE